MIIASNVIISVTRVMPLWTGKLNSHPLKLTFITFMYFQSWFVLFRNIYCYNLQLLPPQLTVKKNNSQPHSMKGTAWVKWCKMALLKRPTAHPSRCPGQGECSIFLLFHVSLLPSQMLQPEKHQICWHKVIRTITIVWPLTPEELPVILLKHLKLIESTSWNTLLEDLWWCGAHFRTKKRWSFSGALHRFRVAVPTCPNP